jgi:hypothetical protein
VVDVVIHGATNHQIRDRARPQGGAVDLSRKISISGLQIAGTISLVSSANGDISQIYQVQGIGDTGAVETENVQLFGKTAVETTKVFLRLCCIAKQSGDLLNGSITVTSGTRTLGTLDSAAASGIGTETTSLVGILGNAVGKATVDTAFYEKFFIRNASGAMLSNVRLEEASDRDGCLTFGVDTAYDDSSTARDRLTMPGAIGPGDIDNEPKNLKNMPADSVMGVWLRIVIPAGESTILKTWKLRIKTIGESEVFTLVHPDASGQVLSNTLSLRTQHPIGGGNPLRYVELVGAKFVEQSFFEPDPRTFRDQFYYNTRLNKLYKKINSKPDPVWKQIR